MHVLCCCRGAGTTTLCAAPSAWCSAFLQPHGPLLVKILSHPQRAHLGPSPHGPTLTPRGPPSLPQVLINLRRWLVDEHQVTLGCQPASSLQPSAAGISAASPHRRSSCQACPHQNPSRRPLSPSVVPASSHHPRLLTPCGGTPSLVAGEQGGAVRHVPVEGGRVEAGRVAAAGTPAPPPARSRPA